jgi:hypothetical protein
MPTLLGRSPPLNGRSHKHRHNANVGIIMQMEVWASDSEPGLRPRSLKNARCQWGSRFSCEEKSFSIDYRESL